MRLVKSARLGMGAMLIALLSVWSIAGISSALAWGGPKDLSFSGISCGGSNCQIFSVRLAAEGTQQHMIYGQLDTNQLYYSRGTTAPDGTVTWERARVLATNVTVQNVPTWDIVADQNGTIHVVYYSRGSLYYIKNTQHGDLGNWTSPETISSTDRTNNVTMKLDAGGTPYVAWTAGFQSRPRFAYRTPANAWSTRSINLQTYFMRKIDIAVTGQDAAATVHVMVEYERGNAQPFSVYYARGSRDSSLTVYNFGDSFDNSSCSCERPRVVVDPATNVLYAGFVGGSISNGYFWGFTRSTDNGASWSTLSRVRAGGSSLWADETPMVAINDTVYMDVPTKKYDDGFTKWGSVDIRYNRLSNSFTAPVAILDYNITNGKLDRNIGYGINNVAKVAVWIRNFTYGPGYNSDPGGENFGSGGGVGGTLSLNNGAQSTTSASVTVNLTNVYGTPTQMRVAVDQPLSDAIPLQPYQASFPVTFTNLSTCAHTVAVSLVNATGKTNTTAVQASITVDAAVQASVVVGNPYKQGNAAVFTQAQATGQAANDGDSAYTRVPAFYAEVNGSGECSSLKQVSVGRTFGSYNYTQPIAGNLYASPLFIPGTVTVGPNQIVMQVQDSVGNSQVYTRTITYDPVAPVLATPGRVAVQAPQSGPNILTTLTFNGNVVTDNLYPNGFWGVWIANSRTPVTNPISDTNLVWSAVQRPDGNADFSINNWSVLGGIPAASQTPGDYYVYVRFLDGAGNPTDGVLSSSVTLNQITKPTVYMPIVVR